ncbi:MAG: hypothetical protein Q8K40_02475 [Ignavibacteria bacterium]|nr:hypothetical protein [Ignavibacteria bacterium]
MYQIINDNISLVLKGINSRSDIEPYMNLKKIFKQGAILNNAEYTKMYRQYWQLNAARLSESFCVHYFQILENCRIEKTNDLKIIVKELYNVSSNSKGHKKLHFSFATKLLHTLNNKSPIYDSMISDFYFLPEIKSTWNFEKKLSVYLNCYDFLQNEYMRVLNNNILTHAIKEFKKYFEIDKSYTDYKIVDTLLWKFTSMLRNGAIMNGKINYN